jgi:two-component system secretion system response regulator SalR
LKTVSAFSSCELDILHLLRKGLHFKLIGDKLHISQLTVSSHVANMFEKVGVTNKKELVNKMW